MKALIIIILLAVLVLIRGVTVMLGWDWFVTPLGAPMVGFAHALGLSTLVALLCSAMDDKENNDEPERKMLTGIVVNVVGLAFMFIYQLFV